MVFANNTMSYPYDSQNNMATIIPASEMGYECVTPQQEYIPQTYYSYYSNESSYSSAPPTPPPCNCAECMPMLVAMPSSPEESFSGSVSGSSTPQQTTLSTSITQYVHDPYNMEPLSIGLPAEPMMSRTPSPELVELVPQRQVRPIVMEWAVEMEFKHGRREMFRMSGGFGEEPVVGCAYIVEGDRGYDLAVALGCSGIDEVEVDPKKGPMKKVVREATQQEIEYHAKTLTAEEQPTVAVINSILRSNGITHVHVYAASYQLDKKKLSFFYESRQRQPDFRPVLSECYAQWKCRIWFTTVPRRYRKDLQH